MLDRSISSGGKEATWLKIRTRDRIPFSSCINCVTLQRSPPSLRLWFATFEMGSLVPPPRGKCVKMRRCRDDLACSWHVICPQKWSQVLDNSSWAFYRFILKASSTRFQNLLLLKDWVRHSSASQFPPDLLNPLFIHLFIYLTNSV